MKIKREISENHDLVWAQMRYSPYWPARVVETPPILEPKPANKICVLFFGSKQFGFVAPDKIQNYSENREKFIKKGRGVDFHKSVQHMDEYISDFKKFRSHACVRPVMRKIVVKTERDIEKQLGIKTENSSESRSKISQVNICAGFSNPRPSISWIEEKKNFIDKIVSLTTENQILTQKMNEQHTELSSLSKSKQILEECLKENEKESALKLGELRSELSELSKSNQNSKLDQKRISDLKRENNLLIGQMKQLKSTLVGDGKEMANHDLTEDDIFDVEQLLDDKLITKTERFYLVRWKGFDSSNDSWERESNLCCPEILKKYKKCKTMQ